MRVKFLSLFLVVLVASSCSEKKTQRPREAWVVRSVLDQQPRVVSIALNDNLWVAYNTQTGGLFKAWTGGINFDGPVYTSAHGPQPTTQGINFLEEATTNPWRVKLNGAEVTPEVTYKGHLIDNNKVTLRYLLTANGQTITVKERPEYVEGKEGKTGFERVYIVEGLPDGGELSLNMHINSVTGEADIEGGENFSATGSADQTIENKTFKVIDGSFGLKNGENKITIFLSERPQVKKEQAAPAGEEAVFAIMAKSDCNTCHNKDVKTVGPAYIDIARKYDNSPQRKDELIAKIINGGAGNWGDVPMTAHPNLAKEDAATMVSYILGLDAKEEAAAETNKLMPKPAYEINFQPVDIASADPKEEKAGMSVNVYQFSEPVTDFPAINDEMLPVLSGSINALHVDEDFGELKDNFVVHVSGILNVKATTNVVFRLVSDDGSRLFIDDKLIVDNGGSHGLDPKDGEMILKAGKHPFKVEYFQGGGGKGLSLQWRPYGAKEFVVVPPEIFTFKGSDIRKTQQGPLEIKKDLIPGDGSPLVDVHPSFNLQQARPESFQPKVGGMDFLSDGRLVVSTWDSLGSVFILDGVQKNDPAAITVKRIAFGLAEPLGLKVVDDQIYIMQKQELTRLIDHNKDDIIDEYEAVCNGWKVSANFHEFAFGLLYKDGYFYATLATAINPGGASTKPQIPDRGKVVKIAKDNGTFSLVASGLRTPNGIGFGVDNEIFIADNQGDWLPSSKIIHFKEGAWYGSRSVDFEGTAGLTEMQPVVWLPQDEIGNSPSQPAPLNVGPYKNQMIHGEVTHGGVKRVFAEKVNGEYQGAVFRFTQGLEAGVNRLVWGPDGALYIGGVGSTGNWGHYGKLSYGLQKLVFNDKVTFEMLAVRAKSNGIEIEFTEPLKAGTGTQKEDYLIRRWYYKPTEEYGGPKLDDQVLPIRNITVSADRRKVFLELGNMKPKHVVYVRLNKKTLTSESGASLWSTEAWYTMNNVPAAEAL